MPSRARGQTRFLATVVVTDMFESTARAESLGDDRWRKLLDRHDAMVRTRLRRHSGREVKMTGDGVLATFDTPADAATFALDVVAGASKLGIEVRAGAHTGECERRGDDVGGIAVHIASRIAAVAQPGEVAVSSTVKDLATGSGITFTPRDSPPLKGVAEPWSLFTASAPAPAKRSRAAAGAPPLARVLLVDDHPLWRETLRGVLHHRRVAEVIGEADDGAEAVALATSLEPDVVVMDIDLPSMNGVEATGLIVAACPRARVLVLSSSDERAQVLDAVRAGAAGYLLKTARSADISDGVKRVHAGELVFPPALANVVLAAIRAQEGTAEQPLRVAVVAPSELDRRGLVRVVEDSGFEVVWTGVDVAQLARSIGAQQPDVLAIELATDSVEPLQRLRSEYPGLGLLVLSRRAEPGGFVQLLTDDPKGLGFVLKDRIADVAELAGMIERVAGGESVIDPEVAHRLVAGPSRRPFDELTDRELEVLELMAEGRSNQAICERIHVSAKTVEGYVTNIFTKLGLEVTPDDHRRVLAVVAYLRSR